MGTVEVFDHTADLGLRVRGRDWDDVFTTAAEGLFDVIVANRAEVATTDQASIRLEADAPDELLAVWLGELIYRGEVEHRVFGRFAVRVAADGRSLDAAAWGEPIDPARHVLDHEVKAVTRHGLSLARDGDGWVAEVIVDI